MNKIKFENIDKVIDKASSDLEKIYIALDWNKTHWKPKEGETIKKGFERIIRELIDMLMDGIESNEGTCSTGGVIVNITNYKDEMPELTISADLISTISVE